MINTHSLSDSTKEWFIAILLFVMTSPFFLWFFPFKTIAVFIFYILSLRYSASIQLKYRFGFLLLTFFYMLVAIRYGFQLSLLYTMAIPIVFVIDKELLCKGFANFIKLFAIFISISLFIYLLVAILQIYLPHSKIAPINTLKAEEGFLYDRYFFLLIDPTERGFLTRFYGLYDEPGVVGTISSVILVSNKYAFKKNKFLIPVFLAGFFSFSLFFYAITIICVLVNLRKGNFAYVLVSFAIIVYVLSFIPGVDILVYNRFLIEDGVWLGNSRSTGDYDLWFHNFIRTSDAWLGLGPGANLLYNKGGASYKDLIVNYGLLMFGLYIFSLFVLIIRSKSSFRDVIVALVIIMGYVFQRPFITDVFMVLSFLYILFNKDEIMTSQNVTV